MSKISRKNVTFDQILLIVSPRNYLENLWLTEMDNAIAVYNTI